MVSATRLLPLLFLALAACAQPPASVPEPEARSFAPQTGRIIAADASPTGLNVCQGDSSHDARWTPTQTEIDTLDPVLLELVEYQLMEDDLTYEDSEELQPEGYFRDYFGLVREDRQFILVCGQYGETPQYILDGGPWRFSALFDTRLRQFVSFEFGYRA